MFDHNAKKKLNQHLNRHLIDSKACNDKHAILGSEGNLGLKAEAGK